MALVVADRLLTDDARTAQEGNLPTVNVVGEVHAGGDDDRHTGEGHDDLSDRFHWSSLCC